MVHFSQHMIAAGWDADEGDLDFIGEITPPGDIAMSEPVGANHGFDEGDQIFGLDQMSTTVGVNKQTFIIGMTFSQYKYIRSTYLGGGYSGKVTVKTRWQDNSWSLYNCVLTIQSKGMESVWAGYRAVQWTYNDLRAIA